MIIQRIKKAIGNKVNESNEKKLPEFLVFIARICNPPTAKKVCPEWLPFF
jgi:hypothetical protein